MNRKTKLQKAPPKYVCDFCGHWWQNKKGDGPDCVICGAGSKIPYTGSLRQTKLAVEADLARQRVSKYTSWQKASLETSGRLRSLSKKTK